MPLPPMRTAFKHRPIPVIAAHNWRICSVTTRPASRLTAVGFVAVGIAAMLARL